MPTDANIVQLQATIQPDQNIYNFHQLQLFASGMSDIDRMSILPLWRHFPHRYDPQILFFIDQDPVIWSRAYLKNLQISSPAKFTISCRPEWLAVYLTVAFGMWGMIASYHQFKDGFTELQSDIEQSINRVETVADPIKRLIIDSAGSFLDELSKLPPDQLLLSIRYIQETQRKLGSRNTKITLLILEITEEDNESTR